MIEQIKGHLNPLNPQIMMENLTFFAELID